MKLILASASPRRAEILRSANIDFEVLAAQVDESRLGDESPAALVERLAMAKATRAASTHSQEEAAVVLGADTVVVIGEEILGKPLNAGRAAQMLRLLRGRDHEVITGVAVIAIPSEQSLTGHETTRVWFDPMSDAEIGAYVATGEPLDKAGAYAIQGIASRYIPKIEGDYFNVVGLPMARVWKMLHQLGFHQPTNQ
jgi:septum formation protein